MSKMFNKKSQTKKVQPDGQRVTVKTSNSDDKNILNNLLDNMSDKIDIMTNNLNIILEKNDDNCSRIEKNFERFNDNYFKIEKNFERFNDNYFKIEKNFESFNDNYFKIEKNFESFNDNFFIHKDEIAKYLQDINNHKYITQTNYEQYIPKIYETIIQNNTVLHKFDKSSQAYKQTLLNTKKQIYELKLKINNLINKLDEKNEI